MQVNRIFLSVCFCVVPTLSHSTASSWEFLPLGLLGDEYSNVEGVPDNRVTDLNNRSQVLGTSTYGGTSNRVAWFYDGSITKSVGLDGVGPGSDSAANFISDYGSTIVGQTFAEEAPSGLNGWAVWIHNKGKTSRIGLTGDTFTRASDGYQVSDHRYYGLHNQSGVVGYSTRYGKPSNQYGLEGRSVWFYDGHSTKEIGLVGEGYETDDGFRWSDVYNSDVNDTTDKSRLNRRGQVVGYSDRYNDNQYDGQAAWLYNGKETVRVGLFGDDHTASNGFQTTDTTGLNNRGQVIGVSYRYLEGEPRGSDAWVFDGKETVRIGLTNRNVTLAESNLRENSISQRINDKGHILGSSSLYKISDSGREDSSGHAWLYDGKKVREIGLLGEGFSNNIGTTLNKRGHVIGSADHSEASQVGWFYNGKKTVAIGLTGAKYEQSGQFNSNPLLLNNRDQVAGVSTVYSGSGSISGQEAWFYEKGATRKIGLTGSVYDNTSNVGLINGIGQVTGTTDRANSKGYSAWMYDSELDRTFDLTIFEYDDGYARSDVEYLGEDGTVLGYYQHYDSEADKSDLRPFYFTIAEGAYDVTEYLLDAGLDIATLGWDYIADVLKVNASGHTVGTGNLIGGGTGAYLSTPVPEIDLAGAGLGFALLGGIMALVRETQKNRRSSCSAKVA